MSWLLSVGDSIIDGWKSGQTAVDNYMADHGGKKPGFLKFASEYVPGYFKGVVGQTVKSNENLKKYQNKRYRHNNNNTQGSRTEIKP